MLRIYPVMLAFVADVYPFIERIGRHDPDLAKQLRRASASVVLNTAEGMYARGRQRTASYNIALREMRESYAAPEVSVRLRYVAPLPEALEQRIAHILGTLVRLSFPRLLPKLSIADANSRDALNQRQRELVSDELVMR